MQINVLYKGPNFSQSSFFLNVSIYEISSQAVLSIDSALLNKTSKLPDIFLQNPPKIHQKGFKREFFSEKMTPGNSEAEFYVGVWRTLLLRLMNVGFFSWKVRTM